LVEAATVGGWDSTLQTGQVESVIAGGADPVLGLHQAVAFDAEPSTKQMVDGISEEILRPWWQKVRLLNGLSEEEFEMWSDRAEVMGRCKREIELKAAGQEEDSVDRQAGREVK
jgi:hypothetical protein